MLRFLHLKYDISNQWHLYCLFNSLARLRTKDALLHYWLFVEGIHWSTMDSLQQKAWNVESASIHDVIMGLFSSYGA